MPWLLAAPTRSSAMRSAGTLCNGHSLGVTLQHYGISHHLTIGIMIACISGLPQTSDDKLSWLFPDTIHFLTDKSIYMYHHPNLKPSIFAVQYMVHIVVTLVSMLKRVHLYLLYIHFLLIILPVMYIGLHTPHIANHSSIIFKSICQQVKSLIFLSLKCTTTIWI